jgi:hypothetical protein
MDKHEKSADQHLNKIEEDNIERKTQPHNESEQNKRQESRMMNFFNQEFIDRKIDFKPK